MKRALLVLPMLLLAACGDGGSSVSSGGPSKADYLVKAEAICTKANADVKALPFPASIEATGVYVGTLVDIADKATVALVALTAPAADKADLTTKVLTPLQQQVKDGKDYRDKIVAAVKAKNQAELGALLQSPPTGAKADLEWMKSYGFKECVISAETDK